MRTGTPLLALTAIAALLALAPAANAATPFTAGTGSGADVAVGSDGTGHVVWVTNEADDRIATAASRRARPRATSPPF
jgi:hypothetical protein